MLNTLTKPLQYCSSKQLDIRIFITNGFQLTGKIKSFTPNVINIIDSRSGTIHAVNPINISTIDFPAESFK